MAHWTAPDVARETGLSLSMIYKLASLRQIPHYDYGGTKVFDVDEIKIWKGTKYVSMD